MERIGGDVRKELGRFGPAAGMADLVSAWPEVVGEQIARNAWPARIARDGTLHVATSSSAWAFELGHLEADLRARLSAALGDQAPPRLRFAPGRIPEPAPEVQHLQGESAPAPTTTQRAEAARLAAAVTDEELRELVARAIAASLAQAGSGRPV